MTERATVTQGVQVGVETTPGTQVAANKKFISIGIAPAIKTTTNLFRPMGQKFATALPQGKEWVEAKIDGVGSYSELLWFFNSVLIAASPSTVDTSARSWPFVPVTSSEDAIKTFTVEQGGAVRAHKFGYGLVTDLELKINRESFDVSGTMIGQQITDSITMTASPTTPPEVEILPKEVDFYLDPTFGAIGTTKQTRVLDITWSIANRFGPIWVLNSANGSWVAHVETVPTVEIKVMQEADTQGMDDLVNLRGNTTSFCRIACLSSVLAGSTTQKYSLNLDAAIKVKDVSDFSDQDGVFAVEWTYEVVFDSGYAKALNVVLVNKETSL